MANIKAINRKCQNIIFSSSNGMFLYLKTKQSYFLVFARIEVQEYGERNDNPLQYSCLENPTDRRAWQAIVQRVTGNWTQLSVSTRAYWLQEC